MKRFRFIVEAHNLDFVKNIEDYEQLKQLLYRHLRKFQE
jgi:hypothetical protein